MAAHLRSKIANLYWERVIYCNRLDTGQGNVLGWNRYPVVRLAIRDISYGKPLTDLNSQTLHSDDQDVRSGHTFHGCLRRTR